jgi:GNAT superfamily N-acetyltransferase
VPESPRFREAGIPEINDLWIHEKNRGQGLGTMLIKHLEELARRENYPAIGIGVGLYADYGPAQRLYSHLGYTPDGHGITYKGAVVTPGELYPVDDEHILWSMKIL